LILENILTRGRTRELLAVRRASRFALCLMPLALAVAGSNPAASQMVGSDLLNPARATVAPRFSPLRKLGMPPTVFNPADPEPAPEDPTPAPALPPRLGGVPTFGTPAASGAASTGYDSLGRSQKTAAKGAAKGMPKGRGLAGAVRPGAMAGSPLTNNATLPPVPSGPLSTTPPKLAPPPSITANMAPVSPAAAGRVVGAPPRRRLPTDPDPFGAVGIYYGSFLAKAAVELSGGYDTNPARVTPARGSAFYVVSPEIVVASNWERHSLTADLRGSYTGYGTTFPAAFSASSGAPATIDRPDFTGKINGRVDVNRETRINSELRLRLATDNPGSPNIQAGLARYPVYATAGATLGADRDFNRLNIALSGTYDHTSYQWSQLNDGTSTSNDDRDFTQYAGIARASYDWRPGVKPFVELQTDTRIHDLSLDRYGYQRDSRGNYVKGGSTFELSRLITGEAAIGWTIRSYTDPRLASVSGLLTSASLIWTATPLTTAKFNATSSIDESPLPGVSGVLTRDYTIQVEHAFQRWLTGTAKFGYGTSDYRELGRFDNRFTTSGELVYKLNRVFQIKATVRHDWIDSNTAGASTQATIVMLGVRVQQ